MLVGIPLEAVSKIVLNILDTATTCVLFVSNSLLLFRVLKVIVEHVQFKND